MVLAAPGRSRWRQASLQTPPRILLRTAGWDGCGPSFLKACDVLLGILGALSDLSSPGKGADNPNLLTLKKLLDRNNISCLQKVHGKDEFLQAILVLAPQFRLFGTFLSDNENAGGSAICIHRDLLPEEALVTHLITCHGRDHLVNIQSE